MTGVANCLDKKGSDFLSLINDHLPASSGHFRELCLILEAVINVTFIVSTTDWSIL